MSEPELWLLAEQVMTANQYQAFRLRFHDGLSQRTIAKALGVSRQAVRDRIVNGTERLRQATEGAKP